MRDLGILLIHLIATVAKLLPPGGARAVVAESLLLKHQLLILNRSRARAPNLRPIDRVIASLCAGLMRRTRLLRQELRREIAALLESDGDENAQSNGQSRYDRLRARVIREQRRALLQMRINAEIGDNAFHQVEASLDLAELNVGMEK